MSGTPRTQPVGAPGPDPWGGAAARARDLAADVGPRHDGVCDRTPIRASVGRFRPVSAGGVPVRVAIVVHATRAEVWGELERIEDHVTWMRDATAIRFLGDRRRGVGTSFECDTRVGPVRLTDVMEITGWEPATSMSVAHRGLVGGCGRFSLDDEATSSTRVRWEERLRFPWWLGSDAGALAARPVLAALWRGNLRRLRARIEEGGEGRR